jgi:dephospho-CoA kinase
VLTVGLTGGIGSGKTTFAALLAERGAQVIDADVLGREALQPGKPAWHSVVSTFGEEILGPSMEIDRARLASVVFADRAKLAALNAIVHPVIVKGIAERLDSLRSTHEIVVIDAALIVELGLDDGLDAIIVVTAPEDVRAQRLVRARSMNEHDVRARMDAQAPEDELLARADIVVRNDGSLERLAREADRVWGELLRLRERR